MRNGFWNFSSGPAALPDDVVKQLAEDLGGASCLPTILEIPHRGDQFQSILHEAERDLRELLSIPEHYAVLFMAGGASLHGALIPLNLLHARPGSKADYVVSGRWSARVFQEARRYGAARIAAHNECAETLNGQTFPAGCWLPDPASWDIDPAASYLHYCSNETISGLQFPAAFVLNQGAVPLVQDATSDFLSRPIDVNQFGMIYASAQKNAGIAGLSIVIIDRQLLGHAADACPSALNYQKVCEAGSTYNTPPVMAVHVAGLVFKWLRKQGGLVEIAHRNQRKARLLYDCIDRSGLYLNAVCASCRSVMNVPFRLRDEALTARFLQLASERNLFNLEGHRTAGGIRAALYNAMPLKGVEDLVQFMKEFESNYG